MGDIAWRRGLFQKISTALNLCAYDSGSWILTGIIKAFEYTEYEIQADVMSHSVDGFLFLGWPFLMIPSCAVNSYILVLLPMM